MAWPDRSNSIRPKSLPAVVIATPPASPRVDDVVVVEVAAGSDSVAGPGVVADDVDVGGCAVWRALGSLSQLTRKGAVIKVAATSNRREKCRMLEERLDD